MRRMIIALGAMLLVLLPNLAQAEFRWTNPGMDPYRCAQCTTERALNLLQIPEPLRSRVFSEINSGKRELVEVESGVRYDGMTFGRKNPRVVKDVVAAYDQRVKLKAYRYRAEAGDRSLVLDHFEVCNNWASRIEARGLPALPAPIVIPAPSGPPWGAGVENVTCTDDDCNQCNGGEG